jgi:hypothetical protein
MRLGLALAHSRRAAVAPQAAGFSYQPHRLLLMLGGAQKLLEMSLFLAEFLTLQAD